LAASRARHVRALGLTVQGEADSRADGPEDLVLVDASSQRDYLEGRLGAGSAFHAPLIVVASTAELDSPDLAGLEARSVVLKPVERSALREALAAVLAESAGAGGAAPATAPPPGADPLGAPVALVADLGVDAGGAPGHR